MLPDDHPDRIQIAFDDHHLVKNAGLILPATLALHLGLPRVDSGRGQDRTLRGKAPVWHVPPLRYPFIPAGAALSVRGSSSGRRSRSPRPPPNRYQERLI